MAQDGSSSIYEQFASRLPYLTGGSQGRQPTMSSGTYKKLEAGESGMSQSGRPSEAYGQRRNFDMCMVFRYKTDKFVRYPADAEDNDHMVSDDLEGGRQLKEASPADKDKMRMWKNRRVSILKTLQNCGLHVYCFYSRDRDQIIVKIGATPEKLRNTAALMRYKLQLKPEYLSAHAEYRHDFPGRPELQFTDRRVVSHIYKEHGSEEGFPSDDAMFSTVDKIHILHHIITSTDKDCAGINVGSLMHGEALNEDTKLGQTPQEPLLVAYFPLHEDYHLNQLKRAPASEWFLMRGDFTTKVREYYGDKIAYYYLWQSFYWKWLLLVAVAGLIKQLNDLICRTPDNWSALPFCVLLAVWSTFLPHFWRRQEAKYAISWGTLDIVESLEPCKPDHWGEPRINPVTARIEPHYPFASRLKRYIFSFTVVLFSGFVVMCVILLLLFARHHHKTHVAGGVIFFQFMLAAIVELMNLVLSIMGSMLTKFENHRTQSQHETHQLAKVMVFKFVNSYFALYYITFFKTHAPAWFGTGLQCMRYDCMLDLQAQLGCFVVFRLVVQNALEFMAPQLKMWYRTWYFGGRSIFAIVTGPASHGRIELADMSGAEKQAKKEKYTTFEDFDESLISHGYCTLFAVAAPWVCAAMLAHTLLETYVDKRSMLETKQRGMPRKCSSNEPWSSAFTLYGIAAAFTNVFLVIFAAEHAAFAQMTTTEKLTLFLFIEKLILVAHIALRMMLPEVPRSVDLLQLKQSDMVHRCLENIKVEPNQDYTMFRDTVKNEFEIFERDHMEEEEEEPQVDFKDVPRQLMEASVSVLQEEKTKMVNLLTAPLSTLQAGPSMSRQTASRSQPSRSQQSR